MSFLPSRNERGGRVKFQKAGAGPANSMPDASAALEAKGIAVSPLSLKLKLTF
jgi:hypothetical protein